MGKYPVLVLFFAFFYLSIDSSSSLTPVEEHDFLSDTSKKKGKAIKEKDSVSQEATYTLEEDTLVEEEETVNVLVIRKSTDSIPPPKKKWFQFRKTTVIPIE